MTIRNIYFKIFEPLLFSSQNSTLNIILSSSFIEYVEQKIIISRKKLSNESIVFKTNRNVERCSYLDQLRSK